MEDKERSSKEGVVWNGWQEMMEKCEEGVM